VGQAGTHERAVLDEVQFGLETQYAAVPVTAGGDVCDGQLDVVDAAQPGWGPRIARHASALGAQLITAGRDAWRVTPLRRSM
jgi:hypothetical protein